MKFTGLLLSVLTVSACTPAPAPIPELTPPGDAGVQHDASTEPGPRDGSSDGSPGDGEGDPTPSPLTDQSRSLEDILERGALSQADCDRYFAGETDRETSLRCGKWMFFYAHLEVPGSPSELVDLLRENAPQTVGHSLEQLGLFPDPYAADGLPVGLAPGPDMTGGVTTYTLTCSSCHFGKTPDGRYVVGQPNLGFAFGRFTLAVSSLPELAVSPDKVLADEVERVLGPIRDEVFGNPLTRLSVIGEAIRLVPSLLATQATTPDDAAKLALALSPVGVMDPYAPPSLDDGVAVPVRMSPLWGIDPAGMVAAGSTHGAMLGSNGGAPDLAHILRTFAFIAGQIRKLPLGDAYRVEAVQPLIDYIMTLDPPRTEKALEPGQVARGKQLFEASCQDCHAGPGYAGVEVFDPREIGTDANIVHLVDPGDTGSAIYDVLTPPEVTKGLRARRLNGVWALTRLFHNGSAGSLAEVFCLDGPRSESTLGSGHSTAGHDYTCDPALSRDDKLSLIAFLESL